MQFRSQQNNCQADCKTVEMYEKKRSQYIERRVHTIPLPPKYKLEKKFRAQNIITSKYRRRVLNSEHNERMPFLQKAKYYLHIFKFYSNNLLWFWSKILKNKLVSEALKPRLVFPIHFGKHIIFTHIQYIHEAL